MSRSKKKVKRERPMVIGDQSYVGREAGTIARKFGVKRGKKVSSSIAYKVDGLICNDCGLGYGTHNRAQCS